MRSPVRAAEHFLWRVAPDSLRGHPLDDGGCGAERAAFRNMSIEVRSVVKRFGTFTAVNEVTLHIPGGELVALLGPSGSGKTSLLRIIAGLERPDAGQVLFEGEDQAR